MKAARSLVLALLALLALAPESLGDTGHRAQPWVYGDPAAVPGFAPENRIGKNLEYQEIITTACPWQLAEAQREKPWVWPETAADPGSGFIDGPNLFAYVKQNPYTKWDPEGLSAYSDMTDSAADHYGKGNWGRALGITVLQQVWQMASIGTASKNGAIQDDIVRGKVSLSDGVGAMAGNGGVAAASVLVGGGLAGAVVKGGGSLLAAGAVGGFSQQAVQSGGETMVAAGTGASPMPTMGENAMRIGTGTLFGAATGGLLKAAAAGDTAILANQAARTMSTAVAPSETAAEAVAVAETSAVRARGYGGQDPMQQQIQQQQQAGSAADSVTVSRWGRPGLQAGDWVMNGGMNRWNYIRSGKWENYHPWNTPAPFSSGSSYNVPRNTVQWPSGSNWFRGFFGQRTYTGPDAPPPSQP